MDRLRMIGADDREAEVRWIVRRDFPASQDGYDRAAVDVHLEAIAAAVLEDGAGARRRTPADADAELAARARLLLGQISSMRAELQRLSAWLLHQSATIAEALEELQVEAAPVEGVAVAETPVAVAPVATGQGDEVASGETPVGVAPVEERPVAVDTVEETPFDEVAVDARTVAGALIEAAAPRLSPSAEEKATLEDARLVALDLALGGSSREEIDLQLAARFDLADRSGLVDQVLSAIG